MKIIANEKKIDINRKIGAYTMMAGMIVLVAGLAISVNQLFNSSKDPQSLVNSNTEAMFNYSTIAMFVGLLLTEVSMYYNNRWGRKPALHEKISLSLKGMDDRYHIFHHKGPVPTLLIGPAGIWIIEGMYQNGLITCEKGRYKQAGITWFVRVFYQEGIGRPEAVMQARIEDFERFLKKNLPDVKLPPIQGAILFTSPKANVQVGEDAPYPTLHADKLKDFIRRKSKETPATPAELKPLLDILPQE